MKKNKIDLFSILNYSIFAIVCFIMVYPLWYTMVASLMSEAEYLSSNLIFYTLKPTFDAYAKIFEDGTIFTHFGVTVFITIVGTAVSLMFTSFSAYGLSKKFFGSQFLIYLAVATMFIKPGLIPNYLNLKNLGLINKLAVYILPTAINTFYLIILRTNFREFPSEIEESAKIDGYNELQIFFKIVLPLSKPILAAIGLFFAVQYWNTYQQSVFFISDNSKKTVMEYLQRLVVDSTDIDSMMASAESVDSDFNAETLRLANVVLVMLPILMVYPFLQKYFVKGLMVGSVKG